MNDLISYFDKIANAFDKAKTAFSDTMNSNNTTSDTSAPASQIVPDNTASPTADTIIDTTDTAAASNAAPAAPTSDATPPIVVPPTENTPTTDKDTLVVSPTQEKTIDLDNPEVRLKTSITLPNNGYVTGFSIQGRSHIMMGKGCEDYHAFENLGDGWYLAITSDGAGSARESARGSKANCELATRLVKQLIEQRKWQENSYMPTEIEWYIEIKNIFEVMQTIIIRSAASQVDSYKQDQETLLTKLQEQEANETDVNKKMKLQIQMDDVKDNIAKPLEARDFNATIILMLITPQGIMTAHIGDGRMGYLTQDGKWKALMTPHKGEEASATVFLPNNWNRQLTVPIFKMSDVFLPETHVIREYPKAFVLMSDGCESFSWTCSVFDQTKNIYYDRNEPFERFLNPLIDALNEVNTEEERVTDMIDIINIGTTGGKKEQDDRTMLLGVLK